MPAFLQNFSVEELHRLLDDSLLVLHIAEPLLSYNVNEEAHVVRKSMIEKNFDVVGVMRNGTISGYVRQADLNDGECGSSTIPFQATEIIASRTPLIELLPLLKGRPTFFVLDRTEINSVVNRADLQKWPVRMLFFGLVSMLEMYMLKMVRLCYPANLFKDSLSEGRLAKTTQL